MTERGRRNVGRVHVRAPNTVAEEEQENTRSVVRRVVGFNNPAGKYVSQGRRRYDLPVPGPFRVNAHHTDARRPGGETLNVGRRRVLHAVLMKTRG